jgi:hypothetical protein
MRSLRLAGRVVDVDNFTQAGSKVDYYVVCASAKTVDNPSGL